MRRILSTTVAIAAALALGGPALAAQSTHAKTGTTGTKQSSAKSQSAMGKVTKYDATSRTVTLSTKSGEESFVLASDAKVMDGAKSVADLSSAVGQNAKVHYTEANGVKTAHSISVSGSSSAKASTKGSHATTKQPNK